MTLVPVSKWLSNYLNESFLNKYPIKIINNGIDVNFFTKHRGTSIRKKYNIENKFIILGVANIWDPRKGFLDFLKLSKLID
jgi:glycosyltransferase involved in cell wall biosynthesis